MCVGEYDIPFSVNNQFEVSILVLVSGVTPPVFGVDAVYLVLQLSMISPSSRSGGLADTVAKS